MKKLSEKTKLTEMGSSKSYEKATTDNFRACVMIDSCVYQIGEDVSDRMVALAYCKEYSTSEMQPVQIFDDKGEPHIIEGKLKSLDIEDEDNEPWHRNEPPTEL